MTRRLLIFTLAVIVGAVLASVAKVHPSQVNFHDSENDTVKITQILMDAENITDPNERVLEIARLFIDKPYVAGTLESADTIERLTVNLDEFDCTTFVETVLSLAITAGEHRTSWRDYLYNLEGLRYRSGELNGYPSRLHYFSDWVVDNTHRGNITEVTNKFPEYRTQIKTLDFMSRNADKYTALADSANLAGIKNYEMGYRKHQFPYISWSAVSSKSIKEQLKEGDVVAIITKTNGLDVTHMGFIVKDSKGNAHLLHASSREGKVVNDTTPLYDYLKKNGSPGIRILRLTQ